MPLTYSAETATSNDLAVLSRFEAYAPELFHSQERFLEIASPFISQMPHARFGQHDHQRVFTAAELAAAIGLDADHAIHPVMQWNVVGQLADSYGVDPSSRYKLETMAIVHDWGEPWTGDHVHGLEKDEKAESNMREAAVYGSCSNPDFVLSVIDEMERSQGKGLGLLFRQSEWLGYLKTGANAASRYLVRQRGNTNRFTNAQRIVFGRIATDVLAINEKRISKVAEKNRYAQLISLGSIGTLKVAVSQFADEYPSEYAVALAFAKQRS